MSTSKSMKCTQHEQSQLAGKWIYVESDEEMEEKHLEFLAQNKAGDSLLDARDLQIKNNQSSSQKNRNVDVEQEMWLTNQAMSQYHPPKPVLFHLNLFIEMSVKVLPSN